MALDLSPTPEPIETGETTVPIADAGKPGLRWFSLSHSYTAFTATLLLMASTILSRVIGLVRES